MFQDAVPPGVLAGFLADFIVLRQHPDQAQLLPQRMVVRSLKAAFENAHQRGEATNRLDPSKVADHIDMAIYYKCVFKGEGITRQDVEEICQHILDGGEFSLPGGLTHPPDSSTLDDPC